MNRIICISREYGSGGHEAAKRIASLLDIPCLDKQLMECVIQTSGLPKEILEKAEEKARNPFLYTSVYAGDNLELYGMAPSEIVYELERRYILEQAEKGDCVIVGRCAEEILKGTGHQVASIFITAPFEFRAGRKQKEFPGMDSKKLEAKIRKVDRQRKSYYEYHTGKDWGIPYHYDACLNSASIGIGRIADLIAESFGKMKEGL